MTPFQGIIKFTIESIPIPEGSCQDVNKMLGPVELVHSKFASNISLMILLLEIFGRQAAPTKKSCFLVFCKACADWSACQISNLWDQPFTFLQIDGQILDPLDPQNVFCKFVSDWFPMEIEVTIIIYFGKLLYLIMLWPNA